MRISIVIMEPLQDNLEKEVFMNDKIIWGVTSGLRTLVDDTVRIQIDINPTHFDAACSMFGKRGVEVALAQLVQGSTLEKFETEEVAIPAISATKPKGGPLSYLAGQFCNNKMFWEFLFLSVDGAPNLNSKEECTQWMYQEFGIESRAELDHNEQAEGMFHAIRKGFSKHMEMKG
jgi:hypothetical protein